MSNNSTTAADRATRDYTCVRVYVSALSFSILLFFNVIINWSIVRAERLRTHARFVLLFHLLLSALLYLGTSCVFYLQMHVNAQPRRSVCVFMVTVLISSASNILLTLTAMALDRYCAVCHPLRYASARSCAPWPWLCGACTWAIALGIPLSLLQTEAHSVSHSADCDRTQLRKGELHKVVLLSACTLLILFSYARVLVETRRLGVLNRRNRTACRTIALHGSQLAVYILPNFVSFILTVLHKKRTIGADAKELSAVIVFTFFSLAQCIAPVVYGLHKEELMDELANRYPCCVRYPKRVIGWTVVGRTPTQHGARQRTLTAQTIVSLETPEPEVFQLEGQDLMRPILSMNLPMSLDLATDTGDKNIFSLAGSEVLDNC
ncbi:unnamed protein product [Knipowitschia caucasica]|uniref:G-protein coupled receptors family 1 profile domain-containing protein n=1 Tax=Knipowitschia caucasica TaxID=637954 RepID=A0AAV2KLT8_KNICA